MKLGCALSSIPRMWGIIGGGFSARGRRSAQQCSCSVESTPPNSFWSDDLCEREHAESARHTVGIHTNNNTSLSDSLQHCCTLWPYTLHTSTRVQNNNDNNTIWRGSVLTSEELPPHSGELNHALSQVAGPTQSQLSRPMSSGHNISMEHRLRRKQSNSDTNASNKTYLKETQEKRKEETFSSE